MTHDNRQSKDKANKSEMATPRKPSDQLLASPRRAIPMTLAKETP
jgi:hypothetical protein